jgi:hypothetical protein
MRKKIAKSFNLLDHSIYTEYRKYKKISKNNRIKGREDLRKLVGKICEHIGKEIPERRGGVHIRRLGYFFIWKIPKKMSYNRFVKGEKVKELFNYHTDQYMFSPVFLPSIDSKETLINWSMDNSFSYKIRGRVKERVSEGYKYRMYPYSIYRLNRI